MVSNVAFSGKLWSAPKVRTGLIWFSCAGLIKHKVVCLVGPERIKECLYRTTPFP